jgi:hypothetical protein
MSAKNVINTLIGMGILLSNDDKEDIGNSLGFEMPEEKIINGYIRRQARLRENAGHRANARPGANPRPLSNTHNNAIKKKIIKSLHKLKIELSNDDKEAIGYSLQFEMPEEEIINGYISRQATAQSSEGQTIYVEHTAGEPFTLKVNQDDKIKEIKRKLFKESGIPINEQILLYAGRRLEDNFTLEYYRISLVDDYLYFFLKRTEPQANTRPRANVGRGRQNKNQIRQRVNGLCSPLGRTFTQTIFNKEYKNNNQRPIEEIINNIVRKMPPVITYESVKTFYNGFPENRRNNTEALKKALFKFFDAEKSTKNNNKKQEVIFNHLIKIQEAEKINHEAQSKVYAGMQPEPEPELQFEPEPGPRANAGPNAVSLDPGRFKETALREYYSEKGMSGSDINRIVKRVDFSETLNVIKIKINSSLRFQAETALREYYSKKGISSNVINQIVKNVDFRKNLNIIKAETNSLFFGGGGQKEYIKLQTSGKRLVRYGTRGGKYYMKGGTKIYIK